tara:strand:- start:533 stop:826 length:294 start_codon:yes stop_codon:yes gene_type:complete
MSKTNYNLKISGKNYELNHLRLFKVKYLCPTNIKGSRVKITDTKHNKSIILGYDYKYSDIRDQVIEYLTNKDITIDSFSSDSNNIFIMSTNHSTQIK